MILACFYCSVDNTPLNIFMGVIVVAGVLAINCFLAWALINGLWRDEQRLVRAPLDVEDDGEPSEEYRHE